jgi:antitoxin (DNA-binding transcriptional repressor) of toxin-antitoxin stability system
MKEISIRELHRRTGAWVRSARRYGEIVVRDRNVPVAKLTPITEKPPVNPFKNWKPLNKKIAAALERPLKPGRPVEEMISEDRDR